MSGLPFGPFGPFDDEERRTITAACEAVAASGAAGREQLLEAVTRQLELIERISEVIHAFPSLFASQSLGQHNRDLRSLVAMLSRSNLANFDMFVPTKALFGRDLVMAEVNFYRLLRLICDQSLMAEQSTTHKQAIDRLLCNCLYARLAEESLKSIACDATIIEPTRARAVVALAQLWDRNTYRLRDVFPVLEAAWEARRRVPVTLGTLMGTAEIFGLIREGCDIAFVDYLSRPDHSAEVIGAFREFLFGALTEHLQRLQERMTESGEFCLRRSDVATHGIVLDACAPTKDPASAMFEFFLSRHLQAASRRLANIPGPKRTAEEYVMLYYLESEGGALEVQTEPLSGTVT